MLSWNIHKEINQCVCDLKYYTNIIFILIPLDIMEANDFSKYKSMFY